MWQYHLCHPSDIISIQRAYSGPTCPLATSHSIAWPCFGPERTWHSSTPSGQGRTPSFQSTQFFPAPRAPLFPHWTSGKLLRDQLNLAEVESCLWPYAFSSHMLQHWALSIWWDPAWPLEQSRGLYPNERGPSSPPGAEPRGHLWSDTCQVAC